MITVYFVPYFQDKAIRGDGLGCDIGDSFFVISSICANNPTSAMEATLYPKSFVLLLSFHFERWVFLK